MTDAIKNSRKHERYRKRRRKLGGPPHDDQWVWFARTMLVSPAFKELIRCKPAYMVVMRLLLEHVIHGGQDNGRLHVTYAQFQQFGISSNVVGDGIAIAEALRFIRVERGTVHLEAGVCPDRYIREWNEYTLTCFHVGDQFETNDWNRIRTREEARGIVRMTKERRKAEKAAGKERGRTVAPSLVPEAGEQDEAATGTDGRRATSRH
jgi:hypothetical protein